MKFCLSVLLLLATTIAHAGFEDFIFKVEGDCREPSKMIFHKGVTGQTQKIGTTEDGSPILLWINLSMFPNKTYYLEYIEYSSKQLPNGQYETKILYGKPYKGEWSELAGMNQVNFLDENKKTLFAGVPSLFTIGGKKSLQFMIPPEFERVPARMKYVLVYRITDKLAAYNESAQDYCRSPY